MTYLEDWLQKREPTITMFKNNAVLRVLSSFESESVSGSIKGAFGWHFSKYLQVSLADACLGRAGS
jgi:hypothetical protein